METKFLKLEARDPIQKENGYVEFEYTISGGKRDRMGEILDPKGAMMDSFLKNPLLLWGHNMTFGQEALPIGSVKEMKLLGDKINCKAIIHNLTQLAVEVGQLVKKGFLKTMSVGFIPKERDKKDNTIITKWEMLEHSIVPIPAYSEALIFAKKMGFKEVVKLVEEQDKSTPIKDAEVKSNPKDHKEIESEPAEKKEEKKKYNCECLDCKYTMETDEHCADIKCPKCGGEMRRKERPGPGKEIESPESKETPDKQFINTIESVIKRIDKILPNGQAHKGEPIKVEPLQDSERERLVKEINRLTQLADKILGVVNNKIKKLR